jgi:hypothetical protein
MPPVVMDCLNLYQEHFKEWLWRTDSPADSAGMSIPIPEK